MLSWFIEKEHELSLLSEYAPEMELWIRIGIHIKFYMLFILNLPRCMFNYIAKGGYVISVDLAEQQTHSRIAV